MPTLTDGANINLNLVGSQLSVSVDGGSGSGLDADTVDGNHASAFATAAQGSLADSAVQPGDNVEVSDGGTIGSTSDSDAISIASTGVVTFSQGIALAAGQGINFSAYGSGTKIDSNLLDDYEEGTWSPEYDFATGNATPGASDAGAYRKIGSVVIVTFRVSTDGLSSPTGPVDIINLPFAATGPNGGSVGVARDFSTDMPNIKVSVVGGQSKISVIKNATDAGFTSVQGSDFASGFDKNLVIGTLTYVTS